MGPIAYRLQLPSSFKIHPTFHASLLKLYHGPPPTRPAVLPPSNTKNHPIIEPFHILDWKWDFSFSTPNKLILVQWNDLAQEDTTWEQLDTLRQSYNLGDKVALVEGGDDSNSDIQEHEEHNSNRELNHSKPRRNTKKPHASMTSFEATKQELNLFCYTHYLFPLSLPFS